MKNYISTNIYATNIRAPQYIKQILTNQTREINSYTFVSDFSGPDHPDRKSIKETEDSNNLQTKRT